MENNEITPTKQQIEDLNKLSFSSISLFVAEHFLNEMKGTKFYSQKLKMLGNKYHNELIKHEKYYDDLENIDKELLHNSSDNLINFIKTFVSKGWVNFRDWQQVYIAFTLDPKSILKTTEEILTNKELNP